jgi:hypothetical protein
MDPEPGLTVLAKACTILSDRPITLVFFRRKIGTNACSSKINNSDSVFCPVEKTTTYFVMAKFFLRPSVKEKRTDVQTDFIHDVCKFLGVSGL